MVVRINKVIRNFISISFGNLFSQLLNFFVITYCARILGTSLFGDLSTAQSIIIYFNMIVMLGLQTYGTREVSKSSENIPAVVGNIVFIRTCAFFASYLILILITFVNKQNQLLNTLMIIYGITLFPSIFNLDWFFSATQEMHHNAVYNLLKSFIPGILVICFVKYQSQVYLIPIFTLVGLFIALLYQLYVFFIAKQNRICFDLSINVLKKYLVKGFPFMISGILAMINCNVDRIIINFTRGSGEAGIYSAGYNIILFLTNFITLIFTPVFPLLINYYHGKAFKELKSILTNLSKIVAILSLPLFAGGTLLSKDILLFLFGSEYSKGAASFAILMSYIIVLFIREIYGYCLNAWEKEKIYLRIVLLSSMLNLGLNLILTPTYGMNVAAAITLLSEIINLILMRRFSNRIFKVEIWNNLNKALYPSLIMSAAILLGKYFSLNLLIIIFMAICIYFYSSMKFKIISFVELKERIYKKEGNL